MQNVKYGNLDFKEAIAFFRAKLNVPTERWNDIWRTGHNSGFMVAGALKDNLLNDFRQSLDRAIAEGKSLTWFKREFKTIVNRHGWDYTGSADWRSDIIYQTNMRQSYNAGRYAQLQHFDYWEYQHGDSISPRLHHLKWHGTVLAKDDPWWQTHMPQNGWGCKCKVRGRSQQALNRMGKKVTPTPNDGTYQWVDKVTGETFDIPKGIDPGFDYAPSKSAQLARQQQARAKAVEPYQPPKRTVPTAFSTIKGVNVHGLNQTLVDLAATDSAAQVALLESYFTRHNTQTIFIKQSEMSWGNKASLMIQADIADYLNMDINRARSAYITRKVSRTNGFTFKDSNHVVVKSKASVHLSALNIATLKQAAAEVVSQRISSDNLADLMWSLSNNSLKQSGEAARVFTTWLHEIGHQVHFKAGTPDLTKYGTVSKYGFTNHKEHFAEWFTAWVLAPEKVKEYSQELYTLIKEAVKGTGK